MNLFVFSQPSLEAWPRQLHLIKHCQLIQSLLFVSLDWFFFLVNHFDMPPEGQ